MKNIVLIISFSFLCNILSAQATTKLVENYLSLKNALVEGNSGAATQAIQSMNAEYLKDKSLKANRKLIVAIEKVSQAKEIEIQRSEFKELSILMHDIVKTSEGLKKELYYQYCPMQDAYWLSTEKEIRNPYYGSSMLKCGKVIEVIE